MKKVKYNQEELVNKIINEIGSTKSLIIHTLFFVCSLFLSILGIESEHILLVLTTIVSLEAIYLSIFIQMSVNLQSKKLNTVALDVEEIQDDVEEIQKDVEEIQENVEEINEDEEQDYFKMKESIEKLTKEVNLIKKKIS